MPRSSSGHVFPELSLTGWIRIFSVSLLFTACGHDTPKGHSAYVSGGDLGNNSSIVGTWRNDECTPVVWDTGYDGTQKLWHHETLTITENTYDSVYTYFVDAVCTQQDRYQPTGRTEGLLSYRLGDFMPINVRKIDFTSLVGTAPVYTVVSVEKDQLRFGDAKDTSEDGKSDKTRMTKIGSRAFNRVNDAKAQN